MRKRRLFSVSIALQAMTLMGSAVIHESAFGRTNEATLPIAAYLQNPQNPMDMAIFVPRPALGVRADPSMKTAPSAFGVVGGLIEGALERGGARKDLQETEALRQYLSDYRVQSVAESVTQNSFGQIPWLHILGKNSSNAENRSATPESGGHGNTYISGISYDYGIDYEYTRSSVFCEIRVVKVSTPWQRIEDISWNKAEPVATYRAHSITIFDGLPKDKKSRILALSGGRREQFRVSLDFGFSKCAELLSQQMIDTEFSYKISDAMAKKTITYASKSAPAATQDSAWIVNGEENISSEKFGSFGSKLSYIAPGTTGALLYSVRKFPVHVRTLQD
jgi:hypothetical protein